MKRPPHSSPYSGARRAFTLIELLVVIVIIALLAAIIFPVLAQMKERAKIPVCMANLRQIGIAFSAYTHDWDERYPGASTGDMPAYVPWRIAGNLPIIAPKFSEVLEPYVRCHDTYCCPADVGEIWPGMPKYRGVSFHVKYHSSYIWRGWQDPVVPDLCGRSVSEVKLPSEYTLAYECRTWHRYWHSYGAVRNETAGYYNTLFCDGHVRMITDRAWHRRAYLPLEWDSSPPQKPAGWPSNWNWPETD